MALGCDPVSLHGFQAHHTPQECLLPTSLLAALPPFFLPRHWQSREGPAGEIAGSQRPAHFGVRCSCSALLPCSTQRAFHHFRDTRNSVKARTRTSWKDSAGRSGCLGDCWAWWGHERSGTSRTGQAHTSPGPDEECARETCGALRAGRKARWRMASSGGRLKLFDFLILNLHTGGG